MYRQRGKAEGHIGELMSVVNPALSSSPRPKRHYRGRPSSIRDPKAWHSVCARNRDPLALSADRSPKPLRNDVLAPQS